MKHLVFGPARGPHIQLFRYLFVGGTSAIIDLMVFGVLQQLLAMHYLLAAFFAYMCGLVWNYTVSVLWVFKRRHARHKEMLMVFAISIGGLAWTEFLLWIGVAFGGFPPFWTKVVVLWIVLIWNFGMRKLYVFH